MIYLAKDEVHMNKTTFYLKSVFIMTLTLIAIIPNTLSAAQRFNPETDLKYLGAFRMPSILGSSVKGYGLTFYPKGNGGQGSLFIIQGYSSYGTAEISIPAPINSKSAVNLNRATLLQSVNNITRIGSGKTDYFGDVCYIPRLGNQTTDKLYWSGYQYYNVAQEEYNSIGWADLTLSSANSLGPWHVGDSNVAHINRTGEYLFEANHEWSDTYTNGKYLITGRQREAGGAGGSQGPTLYAIAPWKEGNPPPPGTNLPDITLLEYPSGASGQKTKFPDFSAKDYWNGAVWITAGDKQAVLIVGLKGTGSCYGDGGPCGDPCDPYKGYHAYPYSPKFVWYDVNDLALVAMKNKNPEEVIPYSFWTPTANTWATSGCMLGYGGAAYDAVNQKLYVVEMGADSNAPIVHVFRAEGAPNSNQQIPPNAPANLKIIANN